MLTWMAFGGRDLLLAPSPTASKEAHQVEAGIRSGAGLKPRHSGNAGIPRGIATAAANVCPSDDHFEQVPLLPR